MPKHRCGAHPEPHRPKLMPVADQEAAGLTAYAKFTQQLVSSVCAECEGPLYYCRMGRYHHGECTKAG